MKLFLTLFFLSWAQLAHAQALLAGSQYYDSFLTLAQVTIMIAAGDKAGLVYQVEHQHAFPVEVSRPIILIARGAEPDTPCEFQFPGEPTHFWTFSANVFTTEELPPEPPTPPQKLERPVALAPPPTATPRAQPVSTPIKQQIEWHTVKGVLKWRPLDPTQFKGVPRGAHAP